MARKYTADELIVATRRRAGLPDTEVAGADDATVLQHINEELLTRFVPLVLKAHEGYFDTRQRMTLSSGTTRYRIPSRAIGQRLTHLQYVNSDGEYHEVERITRSRIPYFDNVLSSIETPPAFYIEGNHIVLIGNSLSGYLEVIYPMRPGQLVLVAEARVVQSVDTSTNTITLTSNVPSGWTDGNLFDVHSPESGSELRCWDLTSTSIGSNTIQVSEDIDGSTLGTFAVVAGDYLCLAEEAALPALPRELHPSLAQAAAIRVCESIGDDAGKLRAESTLAQMIGGVPQLIDQRVEQKPLPIHKLHSPFLPGRSFG